MYQKKVQRAEPGLIVLILDDSGSMQDNLGATSDPKFLWVERYTGQILRELLARSTEIRGDAAIVKPRYYLHVIKYGTKPELWSGAVTGQTVRFDQVTDNEELDIEQVIRRYAEGDGTRPNTFGLGGHLGRTDTRAAFQLAHDLVSTAITRDRFKRSFPPIIFHLTDGVAHSDARPVAEKIKQLATDDGNVLLVNAYIGVATDLPYRTPDDFPGYVSVNEAGPDVHSKVLFDMSSVAPETIRHNLVEDGIFSRLRQGSRLYFDVRTKEMLKHVIQTVGSQGSRGYR